MYLQKKLAGAAGGCLGNYSSYRVLQIFKMRDLIRNEKNVTGSSRLGKRLKHPFVNLKALFVLCFLLIASCAVAQIGYEKRTLPVHPRLLFMKGDEGNIQRMIDKDQRMRKLHDYVIQSADSILLKPCNERIKTGIRLLAVSRTNIKYVLFLSYAYRMTGDVRYAERAKKELVKMSEFSDWNPSHYLDVAEMGLAASIGYDWLYDFLDADTRALVEKALVEKIITPSCGKYVFNMRRTNNWNQVCNAGTALAALAIYEKMPKQTVDILNRAIQNLPIVMKEYAPNGAYIEGYGYWGYGTTYNVILIDLLQKLMGSDYGLKSEEGFMETAEFHEALVTPALNYYNYGDNKNVTALGITPAIFWFYKETKDANLLYNSKQILSVNRVVADAENDRFTPLALVWAGEADVNLEQVKASDKKIYQGLGANPVACFRSSWSDKDAAFVGFKGGKDRISHGHQDAGSFIFEVNQVRWALELGQENYTQLEAANLSLWGKDRWKIYRYNCFNHNMFTFNGKPIIENQFIELEPVTTTATSVSCGADLSPLFTDQVKAVSRKVSLVDRTDCVIDDRVTCGTKDAVMCWRMATEAERLTKMNDTSYKLHKGKKQLKFTVLLNDETPKSVKVDLLPAESKNTYDSPNPSVKFVEFKIHLKANSTNHIQVKMES